MSVPHAIQPIRQMDDGDCALAAVAMITGKPYQHVVTTARRTISSRVLKRGLWTTEILALAKKMRVALVVKRPSQIEWSDATGVLLLERPPSGHCHAVAVFQGVLIDPNDGQLWDVDTYCSSQRFAVRGLLEVV